MNLVSKKFGKDFCFESWLWSDGSYGWNIQIWGTKVPGSCLGISFSLYSLVPLPCALCEIVWASSQYGTLRAIE